MRDRVEGSITRNFRFMPSTAVDHYNIVFNNMVSVINEIALVTATRFSRRKVVLVAINQLEFQKPLMAETIVELTGKVIEEDESQFKIQVFGYAEHLLSEDRDLVVSGVFTFKAEDQVRNNVKSTVEPLSRSDASFVGGETELRKELNERLSPKTIARATLYNYLEALKIRKALYTDDDVDRVIAYVKTLKVNRR